MKKMLSIFAGLIVVCSLIALCGCESSSPSTTAQNVSNEHVTITMAGGTALVPIAKATAEQFMKMHPNVQIDVSGGGSGLGIKECGEGQVTIGMAGRDLKPEEKEKYPDLVVYKIGTDGVAVVVNPSNPVSNLSKEQLKKIFSGEITNWKEVGGKDAPITVYTRDEMSGTRDTFWKYGLDKGNITKNAIVVASNGEMKAKIAADKNGIGYLSVGYIDESVKPVDFDGIAPTQENVKKGVYPIYRPLNLMTKGKPEGMVKEYIDYVLSPQGQEIVQKEGFIPVK
jgi:phosphate transport system substrate-binding protein